MLDACQEFLKAKGEHRKFLGGEEPNLADLVSFFCFLKLW